MKHRCETLRFTVPIHGERCSAAVATTRLSDISAWAEDEINEWLGSGELDRLKGFKVDHARRDFLAGRVAAKSALQTLVPHTLESDWEIVSGLWHQPCVRGPAPGLSVTLAHSAGIAVAIAFDDRWICGIDFEAPERLDVDTIRSQVSAEEAAWAGESTTDASARWLFLWTAREAQGKAKRSGLLYPEALGSTVSRIESAYGWQSGLTGPDILGAKSINVDVGVTTVVAPQSSMRDPEFASIFEWLHRKLDAAGNRSPTAPR